VLILFAVSSGRQRSALHRGPPRQEVMPMGRLQWLGPRDDAGTRRASWQDRPAEVLPARGTAPVVEFRRPGGSGSTGSSIESWVDRTCSTGSRPKTQRHRATTGTGGTSTRLEGSWTDGMSNHYRRMPTGQLRRNVCSLSEGRFSPRPPRRARDEGPIVTLRRSRARLLTCHAGRWWF